MGTLDQGDARVICVPCILGPTDAVAAREGLVDVKRGPSGIGALWGRLGSSRMARFGRAHSLSAALKEGFVAGMPRVPSVPDSSLVLFYGVCSRYS